MMTKRGRWILIAVLIVALAVIGLVLYQQMVSKEKIVQEEIKVDSVQEPVKAVEPAIEEPAPIKTPSKEITIEISRFAFDKPEVTVPVGTKVIWKNTDERRHMITNPTIGLFRTLRKSLEQGDTFEYIFTEPGTYEILEANFGIRGLVIVEDTGSSSLVAKAGNNDLITGYIVKQIEINGLSFMLISTNLFVITAILLVIAFYISRRKR